MYVESLSAYARQFLGRMEKPEVDYIKGVCPAIAVEQKVTTKNPRSTVGTTTEIYDYLKLLYARIGKTYSPVSGRQVRKDSITDVVNTILAYPDGSRMMVMAPLLVGKGRSLVKELEILLQKGFSRVLRNDEPCAIEDLLAAGEPELTGLELEILIDRNVVRHGDEDNQYRMADSVQTAFFEGQGTCRVLVFPPGAEKESLSFSDQFEMDGIKFEEPSVNLFSFNNPYGACKTCEGFGKVLGIDEDLVVPDKSLSVYEGAIAPWRTEGMNTWLQPLLKNGILFDFPVHRPYFDLTEAEKELLWTGNEYFKGLSEFFDWLESKNQKIQYRVMLSRYRGRTTCPDCKGSRLRKDAGYVKVGGKSVIELVLLPVRDVAAFFEALELSAYEGKVAQRILTEIRNRLAYLQKVGLGYLTLNRLTSSLSGGEHQRIKLATSLGSALVGSMYILDEPSIGLHPRDTRNLVEVLQGLRDMGNTVIVVEHEEDVMRAADQIIDIGPDAGENGGTLVFQGDMQAIRSDVKSYTARFLNGTEQIALPAKRRSWNKYIHVIGAVENNLRNVQVKFPLGIMTAITGVSGSGKSTLVKQVLYPALAKMFGSYAEATGKFGRLEGDLQAITQVDFVDQNPIGKSSRSNPVTYVKAYDAIRQLYAEIPLSVQRGYKPAFFSFNVEGGRCETCQGEGVVKIEMQFMADIYLTCESCKGKRFKSEILDIQYQGKNIAEVLALTVTEALEFFRGQKKITEKLQPLEDVGLGYIRLGQSSNTLSGGEAQRVKLASYLVKGNLREYDRVLFIFDEPTTGLHFHDIRKLLNAFEALLARGHTILVIEHNMDVVKCADWVIDMGPDGGDKGGQVCFEGTPEEMATLTDNFTASYLLPKLLINGK
jgi:excinuclease ABC subunit A